MDNTIEAVNLKKAYGLVQAVKGIDFNVESGMLFAFLGPNGAGKSTTIDMLCTLLQPDSGDILIDGHVLGKEDDKIRQKIGIVFQNSMLDSLLSVEENLYTRGSFYKLTKQQLKESISGAADATGINDFIKRPYGKLSGGQKRRADIARALINTPKILFLDEPTTGLDPQTRKNIWEAIRKLQRENGLTVFFSTHYMEEAAGADYIVVIDNGEIAAKGTPDELRQRYSSDHLIITTDSIEILLKILNENAYKYSVNGNAVTISLEKTIDSFQVIDQCRKHITNIEIYNGTMDDAFIGITGKEIRE